MDSAVAQALVDPRTRDSAIKIEKRLIEFMENVEEKRMQFPVMTSFERMLAHKTADYFKIDHILADNEQGERVVTLIKKGYSKIPELRFEEWVRKREEEDEEKKTRIMKREKIKLLGKENRGGNDEQEEAKDQQQQVLILENQVSSNSSSSPDLLLMKKLDDYSRIRNEIFAGAEEEDGQFEQELEFDQVDELELYVRNPSNQLPLVSRYLQVLGLPSNLPVNEFNLTSPQFLTFFSSIELHDRHVTGRPQRSGRRDTLESQ
jgi:hypothetical protein